MDPKMTCTVNYRKLPNEHKVAYIDLKAALLQTIPISKVAQKVWMGIYPLAHIAR